MTKPLLRLLALSAFLWSSPSHAAPEPGPTAVLRAQPPPVVLISLDTLRADHVGSYGYERNTTPFLDAFAKDAVSFDRAFTSGGGTLPAHMTLLTGLPPSVHGVTAQSDRRLATGHKTLAELLRSAGYRTAGFTGAGYVRARWGFNQGFDSFDDAGRGFEQILPKALAWLDQADPRPPFLFLHTLDIHSDWDELPYDAPLPYRDQFVGEKNPGTFDGCRDGICASKLLAGLNQKARKGSVDLATYFTPEEVQYVTDLYDGGVAYTDARFGQLIAELTKRGLYDNALIVVISDHGEEFLDHGLMLHEQIYDELVRVPVLIKLPGGEHGGSRARGLVGIMDVAPTVLEVTATATPPGVIGTSLLPLIENRSAGRSSLHIYGKPEKLRTLEWSLLRAANGDAELYDLKRDPGEKHDVAAMRPGMVEALSRQLDAIKLSRQALRPNKAAQTPVELTPKVVEQLEALGYLQD